MLHPPAAAPTQDLNHVIQTTRDGHLDDASPHAHVVDLVDRAIASGRPLVIHLHGGLVPKESAYQTVNWLQPQYLAAGFFPIFIVWRTGLFDAVKNAEELVHRPIFARLLERLLKYFVSKYTGLGGHGKAIGARVEPDNAEVEVELSKRNVEEMPYEDVTPRPSQADMSEAERQDFLDSVDADPELQSEWNKEIHSPETAPGGKSLSVDPSVRDEALVESETKGKAVGPAIVLAKHAVKIAARIVKRFYKHRDHGLHTTLVEEILRELYVDLIGTEVWQFMKQDSADTFDHEGETPERGGWLFMRLLGAVVKERAASNAKPLRISIVGHSAGCIYAANLLKYLAEARETESSGWHGMSFEIGKLVFLAPAITCKTLSAMLKLHNKTPLFNAFRMFSLTDADEHGYYEVPVLYSGSLLYIISGLLESADDAGTSDMPIVGMQRFARTSHPFSEPEVVTVWGFLHQTPGQLVWSGDARGPGLNCDSKRHGDFARTPATVDSFIHFLA